MSFGAKEARETKIKADRRPRINLCTCGEEIDSTALLCHSCDMEVHSAQNDYGSKVEAEVETG